MILGSKAEFSELFLRLFIFSFFLFFFGFGFSLGFAYWSHLTSYPVNPNDATICIVMVISEVGKSGLDGFPDPLKSNRDFGDLEAYKIAIATIPPAIATLTPIVG